MMRRLIFTLAALAVFAGCGGGEPTATTETTPAATAPDGGMTQSTSNTLPEQFPSDFPLPEGSEVVHSAWTNDVGGLVYFHNEMSDEELPAAFESVFAESEWTMISCQILVEPTRLTVMAAARDNQVASVSIGSGEGGQGEFEGKYSFWVSIVLNSPQEVTGGGPAECQEINSGG